MDEERPAGPARRPRGSITIQIGVSTILLVIALVAMVYLLFRIPHFWLIVLSAIVLATAIDGPATALQKRGISRPFGILIIYLVLVLFFAGALVALAPVIAGEARALTDELPGHVDRLEQMVSSLSPGDGTEISLASFEAAARSNASGLARGISDIGLEFGRTAFYVFVTLVVAFFLAVEPGTILRQLSAYVPPEHRPRVSRIMGNIHLRIGEWARGQLLIAIIFGVLMGAGLRVIGVPYAYSLGVVAGILEVVPYVGGVITVILAAVSAATIGIPQVIAVVILYVVLVNLESHVLAPLLYGKALGLPPVAVLLALLAGVELLGILGALLAIPLTVIIWAIAEEFAPRAVDEPATATATAIDPRPDG